MADNDQQQIIDEIFVATIELKKEHQREFLSERCATLSPSIRQEVEKLLAADDAASSTRLFLRVAKQRESAGLARLARWRLAWQDLREGRDSSALERLRPLARGSVWDIEVQRARYWSAVAKLGSDPEAAHQELSALVEKIPLSYYGLLSADRLGVAPAIEHSFLDADDPGGPFLPEQRTAWLLEAGFPDHARAEVESWVRGSKISRRERMAAASLLHGMGNHFRAVRLVPIKK